MGFFKEFKITKEGLIQRSPTLFFKWLRQLKISDAYSITKLLSKQQDLLIFGANTPLFLRSLRSKRS